MKYRLEGFRFAMVPFDLIDDPEVSQNDLTVWLAIKCYCNSEESAWPSVAKIAVRAKCSERTVQRSLKSLEELGYLSRTLRVNKDGGNQTTLYALRYSRPVAQDCDPPGDSESPGTGDTETPNLYPSSGTRSSELDKTPATPDVTPPEPNHGVRETTINDLIYCFHAEYLRVTGLKPVVDGPKWHACLKKLASAYPPDDIIKVIRFFFATPKRTMFGFMTFYSRFADLAPIALRIPGCASPAAAPIPRIERFCPECGKDNGALGFCECGWRQSVPAF